MQDESREQGGGGGSRWRAQGKKGVRLVKPVLFKTQAAEEFVQDARTSLKQVFVL